MYFVYILYNEIIDKFYIGYTSDILSRIYEHNKFKHKTKFTRKNEGEWILVYKEIFNTKSEAINREKKIKSYKSRKYIEKLIEQVG